MVMGLLVFCCVVAFGADEPVALGPIEVVAEGFEFTEGPLWLPGEGLVFSDIPADTIYKADKTVFRKPSGRSNGLALDSKERLIACEHWNRRVTRTEKDGTLTVLADQYLGRKFNSPNDVAVRSDGMVFFTDPPYGLEDRERELDFSGVYAIAPEGKVTLLSVYFKYPNGLAFSPDEETLYVGDSGAGFIEAFDVGEDGTLSNGRLFCRANPDGMKVDAEGRLWTTDGKGVTVLSPDGRRVGAIAFPRVASNCAFGDEDFKTLFVTARSCVYRVRVSTAGLRPGLRN
jgi:gluconolactonase